MVFTLHRCYNEHSTLTAQSLRLSVQNISPRSFYRIVKQLDKQHSPKETFLVLVATTTP